MSGWRRNGILVIFAICICTLIIGRRHLEENGLYLKTPKPAFHLEVAKNGTDMKQKYKKNVKKLDLCLFLYKAPAPPYTLFLS